MAKTLYDVLIENKDEEFTVTDDTYDIEIYFSYLDGDDWDKNLMEIAKVLDVKRITANGVVIVNLSEVIENKLAELENAELFIECEIDSIMEDIDNIFAGYVSESWMRKFANVIAGDSNG